jgi:hypothetical protein
MKNRRLFIAVILSLMTVSLLASCNEAKSATVKPAAPSDIHTAAAGDTTEVSSAPAAPFSPTPADAAQNDAAALFLRYGWSDAALRSSTEATLPQSLVTNVEDSPMQFYWMRAVVLSEDIGFDLKAYLGRKITIEVYSVTARRLKNTDILQCPAHAASFTKATTAALSARISIPAATWAFHIPSRDAISRTSPALQ